MKASQIRKYVINSYRGDDEGMSDAEVARLYRIAPPLDSGWPRSGEFREVDEYDGSDWNTHGVPDELGLDEDQGQEPVVRVEDDLYVYLSDGVTNTFMWFKEVPDTSNDW